jgi:alcohol dehydrogenase
MASVDYPGMLRLVEAGTLRPQDLVERVVGLADGARLLPALDTAAPVGVTLIDPRLPLFEGETNPPQQTLGRQ